MEPGTVLGPYCIDRELGSGGMGTVYRAKGPEGAVALKVVHPQLLDGADAVERFRREVEIGRAVDHPNVVRTLAGGEADGRHFMAMEYVEGQTLDGLLDELEHVPEELCRHIGREVCKGLAAIHAAGAIHRDVKPDNVLIAPDHVVKIMDLGVARSMDDALRLSQSGMFVGSVEYAAPEQFKGGDVDGRTDLHALGLVLYELASGAHPYRGGSFHEVLSRVCDTEPRRLGDVNLQLSAFFEEVVHTLLVKDPRGRFASAAQLLEVLEDGEDSTWWHERARELQATTKRPIRRVRIPRETAVYGREAEIATLRGLYDQAKSGDGQVVLLEGEAGIGKSRLIDELLARLHADGEDLNFLFGSYPPGGAATAEGGFSSAYREQFGEPGSARYLPENQSLVPAFDALLRGEGAPPDAQALNKGSLQTCFVRATQTLAAERMTIVLIDDLHFAPEEGRALFTSLAMAVPGHRVMLVGMARPGVPEDWLASLTRLDQTEQLPLLRLGPKDLVRLLQDTLQSEHLARDLGNQIALHSDGNPFFVFEILRGLREGQFITQQADGTWVGTKAVERIQIPSSVLDLVNARVADLTEDERNLLDMAACCGFEFDPVVVGDALGLAHIPTLRALGNVERQHRLVRSHGRRYCFDHHQVQEALYGGLNEVLREEYHAALAEALESRTNAAAADPESLDGALCVDLCEHFLSGARGPRALRYLDGAHAHLRAGYLNDQVASLLGRALAVPDLLAGVARAVVLMRVVAAYDRLGRRAEQEKAVLEAKRLADAEGDDTLRIRATRALGGVYWITNRPDEAEAAVCEALQIARSTGDPYAEAGATGNLGTVFYERGRLVESRAFQERAIELYREAGLRRGESIALGGLGAVCFGEGRLPQAQKYFESELALCPQIGHRSGEATARFSIAVVSQELGDTTRAEQGLVAALALCESIGYHRLAPSIHIELGRIRVSEGDAARARESFVAAREVASRVGIAGAETLARCHLAGLPGGDGAETIAAVVESEERLEPVEARAAHFLLWKLTGDRAHLETSKRLLDAALSLVDDETRTSMVENLRLNREIAAASN